MHFIGQWHEGLTRASFSNFLVRRSALALSKSPSLWHRQISISSLGRVLYCSSRILTFSSKVFTTSCSHRYFSGDDSKMHQILNLSRALKGAPGLQESKWHKISLLILKAFPLLSLTSLSNIFSTVFGRAAGDGTGDTLASQSALAWSLRPEPKVMHPFDAYLW